MPLFLATMAESLLWPVSIATLAGSEPIFTAELMARLDGSNGVWGVGVRTW